MKKVISLEVEERFISMTVKFAKENSMTATNIMESIERVICYVNDNAILEKEIDADNVNPSDD
ncbi:MAG: hypothetical protein QM793_06605 [Muricomes sp.]